MLNRVIRSFFVGMAIALSAVVIPAIAQLRQVDQGLGGVSPWPSRICDTSGTNCVAVETTGTVGIYALRTISVSVGGGGGTVDQGIGGLLPWLVKFDTTTTNNDVDVITATITQMPSLTFTSGTIGQITMPSLTFTSGSVTNTVTAQITGTPTVTGTVDVSDTSFAVTGTVTATPTGTQEVTGTVACSNCGGATGTAFNCSMTSTATAAIEVTACGTVSGGNSRYLESMQWSSSIISTTANFMTVLSGSGTNCGTGTTTIWRGYAAPAFAPVPVPFNTPIKLTAGHAVCYVHPGAGTRLVNVQGYVAP